MRVMLEFGDTYFEVNEARDYVRIIQQDSMGEPHFIEFHVSQAPEFIKELNAVLNEPGE